MKKILFTLHLLFFSLSILFAQTENVQKFNPSPRRGEILYFNGSPYTGEAINFDGTSFNTTKLRFDGHYLNGRPNGIIKKWYSNYRLEYEENYTYGELDGKQTDWFDNGKKSSEKFYSKGIPIGKWTTYDVNENVLSAKEPNASKYPEYGKTISGLYYNFIVENKDSSKAQKNEILTLLLQYSYKDSTIFTSKGEMILPLGDSEYKGDIFAGLAMMHKGDSASFMINADSFFMKTAKMPQRPPFIDSNSMLKFDVRLINHQTKEDVEKGMTEKRQDAMVKEPSRIAKYLKDNNVTVQPTEDGLYVIETVKGKGAKPGPTDYLKVNYSVSTIEGKLFYSSFKNPEPNVMQMEGQFETVGLKEGLSLLSKGSRANLVLPSQLAFGEGNNSVEPYTPLLYDVQLVDFVSKAQYDQEAAQKAKGSAALAETAKIQEPVILRKYLTDNKITVKPTPTGLYYVELKKGTGAMAAKGMKVKVHYEGKLMNGTIIDSSIKAGKPFEFVLGQNQVIPGWDEGIAKMSVGGKAKLIIPSSLGYGAQANQAIPAFSTMVFEVELLDVK